MATAPQQRTPAAPAVHGTRRSATTVTVACKIQNGVVLQLQREIEKTIDTPGGPRTVKEHVKYGQRYTVRGPAYPVVPARGFRAAPTVHGAYALTSNIPADFFEKWLEQNRLNPIVANKMIFAHGSRSDTIAEAREKAALRSGFEPIDPDSKDPRMPKPISAGLTGIEAAEEMANRAPLDSEPSDEEGDED